MESFEVFKSVIAKCWEIWNIEFQFAGITFTLANVAAVAVYIFVLGVILDVLLDGNWGD